MEQIKDASETQEIVQKLRDKKPGDLWPAVIAFIYGIISVVIDEVFPVYPHAKLWLSCIFAAVILGVAVMQYLPKVRGRKADSTKESRAVIGERFGRKLEHGDTAYKNKEISEAIRWYMDAAEDVNGMMDLQVVAHGALCKISSESSEKFSNSQDYRDAYICARLQMEVKDTNQNSDKELEQQFDKVLAFADKLIFKMDGNPKKLSKGELLDAMKANEEKSRIKMHA